MVSDIIERKLAHSNEEMVVYLHSLRNAMLAKPVAVTGKKKKSVTAVAVDKDALERIDRSIGYYSECPEYVYERDDFSAEESPDDIVDIDGCVTFRDYQIELIDQAKDILNLFGFVYLRMQVRTGKTLTAFGLCQQMGAKNVLFITKKKAMVSVSRDYGLLSPEFALTLVNYESVHKIEDKPYDFVIIDEAHSLGAYPKPSNRAIAIGDMIQTYKPKVVLMSGTPTPESYSQMYHQVWKIPNNPFSNHKTFYKFAHEYVDIRKKKINGLEHNDYDKGLDTILEAMKPYSIEYTQQEAGFTSTIVEHFLYVEPDEVIKVLAKKLKKNRIIEGKDEVILADSGAKFMSKLHQMYSGTIKFESGNSIVLSYFKAEFIKRQFDGCKIAIFYKFKEEYEALKEVFKDKLTNDHEVFKSDPDMNIAWQIVSGREGTSLKEAEYIVYYNIDFSATSYWQSRDRMTTIDRPSNEVYWIFAIGSLDEKIYKMVSKKKNYTLKHFEKDLLKIDG
jgi:hypothetical protein